MTATSATRITDTVAWFPETEVTPPLPDTNELLIAAIKDFLHAIKKYNLTGEIISPTLAQELQDLATLHNAPPIDLLSAPETGTEKRVVLPEDNFVQEERVVLPTLALPNTVHTVPVAPQPILPPLPTTYPPPPGLLAISSRHGSPKFPDGSIRISTDNTNRANKTLTARTYRSRSQFLRLFCPKDP